MTGIKLLFVSVDMTNQEARTYFDELTNLISLQIERCRRELACIEPTNVFAAKDFVPAPETSRNRETDTSSYKPVSLHDLATSLPAHDLNKPFTRTSSDLVTSREIVSKRSPSDSRRKPTTQTVKVKMKKEMYERAKQIVYEQIDAISKQVELHGGRRDMVMTLRSALDKLRDLFTETMLLAECPRRLSNRSLSAWRRYLSKSPKSTETSTTENLGLNKDTADEMFENDITDKISGSEGVDKSSCYEAAKKTADCKISCSGVAQFRRFDECLSDFGLSAVDDVIAQTEFIPYIDRSDVDNELYNIHERIESSQVRDLHDSHPSSAQASVAIQQHGANDKSAYISTRHLSQRQLSKNVVQSKVEHQVFNTDTEEVNVRLHIGQVETSFDETTERFANLIEGETFDSINIRLSNLDAVQKSMTEATGSLQDIIEETIEQASDRLSDIIDVKMSLDGATERLTNLTEVHASLTEVTERQEPNLDHSSTFVQNLQLISRVIVFILLSVFVRWINTRMIVAARLSTFCAYINVCIRLIFHVFVKSRLSSILNAMILSCIIFVAGKSVSQMIVEILTHYVVQQYSSPPIGAVPI